jgi:cytosine permease
MNAADLGPVPAEHRRQSAFDLFLIFAGANIVATTLQTGATLSAGLRPLEAMALIATGAVFGSALVAALAPLGPRLGVPSIVAARDAFGWHGAAGLAGVLYVTNFAWFAINNVIAGSVLARAIGPAGSERGWSLALGLLATLVVSRGPAAVRFADRVAVPVMLLVGAGLTWALWRQPPPHVEIATGLSAWRGLDIVIGYQVSWLLMFADYSRYTPSPGRAGAAVFLGLLTTSLWFMPLGFVAARAASSLDPGLMLDASGLGTWGAILLAIATVTTNFVNVYMSTLAWKSLTSRAADQVSVWSIGLIGTGLGLFSTAWLERYADFMLVLGSVLVPTGGVLLAHFVFLGRRPRVADLYDRSGQRRRHGGLRPAGLGAWLLGVLVYFGTSRFGATLPSIVAASLGYLLLDAALGIGGTRPAPRAPGPADGDRS